MCYSKLNNIYINSSFRAVLGSIERMMAILIEHTAGKWPLWLNPRQVRLIFIFSNNMEIVFSCDMRF